jgi:murein DD-endopeptidase MepM/ murein hydrolase activator NlpD
LSQAVAGAFGRSARCSLPPHATWSPHRVHSRDLVVDLGHAIGSPTWWRAFITVTLLVGGTLFAGAHTSLQPLRVPTGVDLGDQAARGIEPVVVDPLMAGGRMGVAQPMTPLAVPLAEAPERPRLEVALAPRGGESLSALLRRAGAGKSDVAAFNAALDGLEGSPRVWRNKDVEVVLGRRETKSVPRPLESVMFRSAFDQRVEVTRSSKGLSARLIEIPVVEEPIRISGQVGRSLFVSARRAGVPAGVVNDFVTAMNFGVDFQRDVMAKDSFDLVFERRVAADGLVETGGLLYAQLDLNKRKQTIELTKFAPAGEKPQFFHADGMSIRRLLIKTPVDGARISSGFGLRTHPILGFSRMHRGLDFAAPTGTPIMAAGDGVVEFAGWRGAFGKFVRIRHTARYATAYAHLHGFNARTKVGARVSQGQIIGYVGSTGMSTGPHLHYEVHVNGQPVNPASEKLPVGRQLVGRDLDGFKAQLASMRALKPKRPDELAASDARPGPTGG